MALLRKLFDKILLWKFRTLAFFASNEVKSQVAVRLLEELHQAENTLSETSVAIVASGLGTKTSAKRKKSPTKKKKITVKASTNRSKKKTKKG